MLDPIAHTDELLAHLALAAMVR